jgi:hypothetical protein
MNNLRKIVFGFFGLIQESEEAELKGSMSEV